MTYPNLRAFLLRALLSFASPAVAQTGGPCQPIAFEGTAYTVCTVDLSAHDIRLAWKGADGMPYSSLAALPGEPVMAMNAGMFESDLSPVGLYIENGQTLKRANTRKGPGNFHLKPNGIFFIDKAGAGIMETSRYLNEGRSPLFATQSGPMLVIGGALHPRFDANGTSMKIRNGVGVKNAKTVVFAISEEKVSFGAFARLFRDRLGCRNALFLDGSVSALRVPALNRFGQTRALGPMVAVYPKTN